jgi:hypothetical protein
LVDLLRDDPVARGGSRQCVEAAREYEVQLGHAHEHDRQQCHRDKKLNERETGVALSHGTLTQPARDMAT